MKYITEEVFEKVNFQHNPWIKGEYEYCEFRGCDFGSVDLSGSLFANCRFFRCNMSLVTVRGTVFRDVQFQSCKMLGLRMDQCQGLGLSFGFEDCLLDHSSFYQTHIKKTVFKSCQLKEVDFGEANLLSSTFDHCDLSGAIFDRTVLEKADFRTSTHYAIDPENNRIKKAKFSLSGLSGLLGRYDIIIEP